MIAPEPVLQLAGITKRIGDLLANDAIALELRRGEGLALLGENGAGKSTLVSILFGHYVADAGSVVAFGKPLRPGDPAAALAAGIGMVHQHFTLADRGVRRRAGRAHDRHRRCDLGRPRRSCGCDRSRRAHRLRDAVSLALSQHVSGLGITLFATSIAYYAYRVAFPNVSSPPTSQPFAEMSALHVPILSTQTPLTLAALVAAPLLAWVLYRTPLGLAIRMVGENPAAVEGQGIDVVRLRTGAVVAGSALMGVAGAFLTLSAFNAFYFNMVNGRGWICIALVVFAGWRPGKALGGALLFAFFDALQLRLQQQAGGIPYQLYLMAPYVLSIVALIAVARRAAYPQALMKPWRKGER